MSWAPALPVMPLAVRRKVNLDQGDKDMANNTVLILNGSPRKLGNSAVLAEKIAGWGAFGGSAGGNIFPARPVHSALRWL